MVDGMLRSVSSMHTSLDRERLGVVMKEMALGALLAVGGSRQVAAVPA